MSTWTVLRLDGHQWHTHHEGKRFLDAWRAYDALPGPKRFMRNGRALRMAPPDQFDYLEL